MSCKPVIAITGCSSGIGAYCSRRLREDGWHVVASARKPEDLAQLREDGFDAFYLDYREGDSIGAFFDAVMEAGDGRLDALYNNGAYTQPGAVEDLSVDALREQFEANLFGWHSLTQRVVPLMRAQGRGRLVHCSSVLGFMPVPWRGFYTASKYALEGLMLTQRQELAGSGIQVSILNVGPLPTNIAINGLPYVEKYLDVEGSVHVDAYRKRLAALKAGGTPPRGSRPLEPAYQALRRALTDRNAKPHYLVTPQTRMAAMGRRLLPADLLYRLLIRFA